MTTVVSGTRTKDDSWIPSFCGFCYNNCGILVHRVDGVVAKIEGNPSSPQGLGRLCPRGLSGIMTMYDPYRIKSPLKRTNPEKGVGADPKWVEIGWEEALDTIAQKLKKIRAEDPRKLVVSFSVATTAGTNMERVFGAAFGTPNLMGSGAGIHCGNGEHLMGALLHASWNKVPDYGLCQYLLLFGCQVGTGAYYALTTMAQRSSDARVRGMKVVVVDPMCNAPAEKADEWIPIRPGTDGAMALAMLNVLINERSYYDATHLKTHTNGPYLVGPNGYYCRERASGKPLVWDPSDSKAKPYDSAAIQDFALEGTYRVDGTECRPGFQLLKDHLRKFTPEWASPITTIPAETIRRIACEFGEAARIGAKIVIDGKELPYRPVAMVYFTGAQAHKHSMLSCMALDLLNEIVGAAEVPGGVLGTNPVCYGHPETGKPRWVPRAGPDGLLVPGQWAGGVPPYPAKAVGRPASLTLDEILPLAIGSYMPVLTAPDPEKWGIPYKPEALIIMGSNVVMSLGNPQTVVEGLKNIPFVVSFNLTLNETTDALADIVLPDTCYLERLDLYKPSGMTVGTPGGPGEWVMQMRQPVVPPPPGVRSHNDVFLELARRIGMVPEVNALLNQVWPMSGQYKLELEKQYTLEEIVDRYYKSQFGQDRGLDWFKQNGLIKWPKKVEEVYWKPFMHVRVPIYFEWFKAIGEKVGKVVEEMKLPWDVSDYQPLPEWRPCPSHEVRTPGFDFYAFYYRVPQHTFSWTQQNPWLNEAAEVDPWTYFVVLNAEAAKSKGIEDGDKIEVESIEGHKIRARARLSRAIHPEGLGIASNCGHWAPGMPIAHGKGARRCELQPVGLKYTDFPTSNLDLCVKVKVAKL